MIARRVGDVTAPVEHPVIVAHVCNDIGAFGAGVAVAIARRWPQAQASYFAWYRGRHPDRLGFELGAVDFVPVADGITVANMIAQHGLRSPSNRRPLNDATLEKCLRSVAGVARHATMVTVVMPEIGCGFAGGRWSDVEPIVARTLTGLPVTVYGLPI